MSAGLRLGKLLLLVGDCDSKALFYPFQAESGQVTWAWRAGETGTIRECCAG